MGIAVRDAAVKLDEMCARTLDKWDEDYQQLLKDEGKRVREEEERRREEKETKEWKETWKREMKRRESFKRRRDKAIRQAWKEEASKAEREYGRGN